MGVALADLACPPPPAGLLPAAVAAVTVVALTGGWAVLATRALIRQRRALAEMTRIAELTQRAIIRPLPRELGGAQLAAHTESATPHAMVGGDVHDAVMAPAGPRLLVGDVKGGGLAAVRQATAVLAAFREHAATTPELTRLAGAIDAYVAPELGPEDFVTMVLAEFAPGEVRLVNCGHPAPIRIGRRLEPLEPDDPSPPLGLHPRPRLHRYRLAAGERLLLYTDGLTEVRTAAGRTGLRPDGACVRSALTAPTLAEALDRLLALLHERAGPSTDDLTLLLAQPKDQTSVSPSAATTRSANSRTASGRSRPA